MITIFFVDDGQDFLEWDINDNGEVVDCRPFQGSVWVGTKVHNKDIKPGDQLDITMPTRGDHTQQIPEHAEGSHNHRMADHVPGGTRRRLIHAVAKVQQLSDIPGRV